MISAIRRLGLIVGTAYAVYSLGHWVGWIRGERYGRDALHRLPAADRVQ